jgi:formate dehydrogenase gamma subunit
MKDKQEKKYLRMSRNERIQHFILLITFFTLVITGFALKFPESLWVSWIRKLLGENAFELRGDIHRVAGLIMILDSLYHLGYVTFTVRGRQLIKDFMLRKQDAIDFIQSMKYYMGKVKQRPRFGRFSYIEKAEYWAMVWGTLIMGLTGFILWFENLSLPVISNLGIDISTAIHYYEAILATLAIIVWHFYFVIYNPDVYPMNKAWITGYLTEEEMELEHPLELEQIRLKQQASTEQMESDAKEQPSEANEEKTDVEITKQVSEIDIKNSVSRKPDTEAKGIEPDEDKIVFKKPEPGTNEPI